MVPVQGQVRATGEAAWEFWSLWDLRNVWAQLLHLVSELFNMPWTCLEKFPRGHKVISQQEFEISTS